MARCNCVPVQSYILTVCVLFSDCLSLLFFPVSIQESSNRHLQRNTIDTIGQIFDFTSWTSWGQIWPKRFFLFDICTTVFHHEEKIYRGCRACLLTWTESDLFECKIHIFWRPIRLVLPLRWLENMTLNISYQWVSIWRLGTFIQMCWIPDHSI